MSATRLVVFDLDGTLIDSRRDLASAANDLLARRGRPPLGVDQVAAMVGDGARVLVERAYAASRLPPPAASDLAAFASRYDERLLETTRPYEGVDETLRRVAGLCEVAIVTNKPRAPAARLVGHFGWAPLVSTLVGGDGARAPKPSPAGVLEAMTRAGASAAETVMVGDSHVDLGTARAARVRFAFARYGFGAPSVAPGVLDASDWVLDAPWDLARYLEGARGRGSGVAASG